MTKLSLNKTVLKQQRDQLSMFERFLPALDLKRQQLMVEQKRAMAHLDALDREMEQLIASREGLLKLLGGSEMDLLGLMRVRGVVTGQENVLGVQFPVLRTVQFDTTQYSTLAKPFWVDILVETLQQVATLRIRRQLQQVRVGRLAAAVRRITQRVNLFEKVLIPTAQKNIQRIGIYLADAERAAVVRSKIAKAKQRGKNVIRDSWLPAPQAEIEQ